MSFAFVFDFCFCFPFRKKKISEGINKVLEATYLVNAGQDCLPGRPSLNCFAACLLQWPSIRHEARVY